MQLGYSLFALRREMGIVEIIALVLIGIVLSFTILIDYITKFLRELKSSTKKTCKLKNGFEAKISVSPIEKKKYVPIHKLPNKQLGKEHSSFLLLLYS